MEIKKGFAPVYDEESEILILGSFPSVKSRKVNFYYGNRQNRFWKTLCSFFKEEIPERIEDKILFLQKRKIALWDIVTECEIVGSSDATIKNYRTADLSVILNAAKIKKIICNGSTAYSVFIDAYPELKGLAVKLPSTSPANPKFSKEAWYEVLNEIR